jgi:hypothetical protein
MNGYSRRYWLKIFHWATQAHPPILSQRISHHTVPSGTGLRGRPFLALNCQATIIPSLRDKTTNHLSTFSTPHLMGRTDRGRRRVRLRSLVPGVPTGAWVGAVSARIPRHSASHTRETSTDIRRNEPNRRLKDWKTENPHWRC